MPRVSTYQPPSRPPAIDSARPRLTLTRPICCAENPLSTQNGLTMKPIAASPSLNSRMNSRIASMPGRDSSSTQAPNTGPWRSSWARGWRAAPTMMAAPRNIRPTGIAPRNHQVPLHCATPAQPAALANGASAGHSSPAITQPSARSQAGWSRNKPNSVATLLRSLTHRFFRWRQQRANSVAQQTSRAPSK